MLLNILSNRSYNDITQYPVFPWILSNYTDPLKSEQVHISENNEKDNNNKEENISEDYSYRDLSLPMGMLTINEDCIKRKKNFLTTYKLTKQDENMAPYIFGCNYSNPTYVCNYLIRLFPFTQICIEIQGTGFDTPRRLFTSIEKSFKNATSASTDVREIIPEFFYFPEIFLNINYLNMGKLDKDNIVNDVVTPCSNNPFEFIYTMKNVLENEKVSYNINNWIDLIFGYKQNGKNAEKYYNILRDVCSKFNPEKDCEDEKELEQKINEICEMGINPIQLFKKPHPKREKHQKIKAFFYKNIYLQYFKAKENIEKINNNEYDNIKEMKQYYENEFKYFSRGEGGLSSFRILYEEDDEKFNENNANKSIYFIISGKKCLIPPSYKNFIQWDNNNSFYLVKYFKNIKYKFCIKHMWKYKIKLIKITKDGDYLIIGYNNGIIEKYKLIRIRGPKNKAEKDKMRTSDKIQKDKNYKNKIDNKENERNNSKEGLYNILFGSRNKKQSSNNQFYKNINLNNKKEEDNEEAKEKEDDLENSEDKNKDNDNDDVSFEKDNVLNILKEFSRVKTKKAKEKLQSNATSNSGGNGYAEDNEEAKRERMKYLSETYWEKLGNTISQKTYNVWKALDKSLTMYHDLLFERKQLVESVKDLNEKHGELQKLLTQYMNSDINKELIFPPHKSMKG
jgi:hypothetical protein